MGECCLEGCRRFAPDTELAGSSKEEVSLEEGDRVGHRPKKGPKLCGSSCTSTSSSNSSSRQTQREGGRV